jgi:hypothetical protein
MKVRRGPQPCFHALGFFIGNRLRLVTVTNRESSAANTTLCLPDDLPDLRVPDENSQSVATASTPRSNNKTN